MRTATAANPAVGWLLCRITFLRGLRLFVWKRSAKRSKSAAVALWGLCGCWGGFVPSYTISLAPRCVHSASYARWVANLGANPLKSACFAYLGVFSA